ncbi:hypothetical protein GQ85_17710 [Rhodococcus rhodochrous]|nr:hypothetical protein GQ85_17710 [Rhodococcus rhodochrous]
MIGTDARQAAATLLNLHHGRRTADTAEDVADFDRLIERRIAAASTGGTAGDLVRALLEVIADSDSPAAYARLVSRAVAGEHTDGTQLATSILAGGK